MDIKTSSDKRIEEYKLFGEITDMPKYDYAKEGVLIKCLPKILFKGNPILVTFIQMIDVRLIMLMKYVDRLKRFKWITWY